MTNYRPMPYEDHWSSPVAMDLVGQWLSLREVVEKEPDQVPFTDLSLEKKSELVAERIRLRPQFEMSAIGKEIIDKERAIKEVKRRTSLGHTLIEIEQRMIRMLLESARAGKL